MTPSTARSCASVLSHQHQYAGIAVYLSTTGLRDTAALVDSIAVLNVRTVFWHLKSLTTGNQAGPLGPIAPPPCVFADPHAAVLRLRRLLQADLHSTEHLLAQPAFAAHDTLYALALHLGALRRAHRMVTELVDGTGPGRERDDLEGRARHLKPLLDAICERTRASHISSGATATRPRQPDFVQRSKKHIW